MKALETLELFEEVNLVDKVLTLHPQGKKGVRIDAARYELVRQAIREALPAPMRFDDFAKAAIANLGEFDGSPVWYIETVKLDLEARGEIVHDRKSRMIWRSQPV